MVAAVAQGGSAIHEAFLLMHCAVVAMGIVQLICTLPCCQELLITFFTVEFSCACNDWTPFLQTPNDFRIEQNKGVIQMGH